MTTFKEIRAQAKRAGVKVYATCQVTSDDEICVEVKKIDFLRQIKGWADNDPADICSIESSGHIFIG